MHYRRDDTGRRFYHGMAHSAIIDMGSETGYRSRQRMFCKLIERVRRCAEHVPCIYLPMMVIDFIVSNLLRLSMFIYWMVTGRLPEFLDKYSFNDETVIQLNIEMQRLKTQTNKDIGYLDDELKQKQEEVRHLEKENTSHLESVRQLEIEKQDALTRLSELVSVKLRDNNPNIVDLNDQCRPTKLAEMLSELYDNEWTTAYTVLEESFGEKQAIDILLDIVTDAYGFCEEKIAVPWNVLTEWFLDMSLPGAQQTSKWLKDSRKAKIRNKVPAVSQAYEQQLLENANEKSLREILSHTEMNIYIRKCVELCLLMVSTDPPVLVDCPVGSRRLKKRRKQQQQQFIEDKRYENAQDENSEEHEKTGFQNCPNEMELFNKDLFKEYTTRGTYLDYVVWPALFLHKDGPLLSKGIAQGTKEQQTLPWNTVH